MSSAKALAREGYELTQSAAWAAFAVPAASIPTARRTSRVEKTTGMSGVSILWVSRFVAAAYVFQALRLRRSSQDPQSGHRECGDESCRAFMHSPSLRVSQFFLVFDSDSPRSAMCTRSSRHAPSLVGRINNGKIFGSAPRQVKRPPRPLSEASLRLQGSEDMCVGTPSKDRGTSRYVKGVVMARRHVPTTFYRIDGPSPGTAVGTTHWRRVDFGASADESGETSP